MIGAAARLRSLVLAALLVALPALSGCAKKDAAPVAGGGSTTPVAGGELVFGRGHDSVRLDPGHETDGESFKVIDNLYENLVAYADTTTEIVPELATRWEISADGLTYTFHLRPGVTFHDGTPLDAAAVLFSLDRQRAMTPPHPFHSVGGPYTYWQSMGMDDIVDGIRAADDSTVVFTLKRRNAPFLANLAMGFASIVSPTAARKHGEDFFKYPDGHRAVPLRRVGEGRSHRARAQPRLLGREAVPRSRRVPLHPREHGAPAGARERRDRRAWTASTPTWRDASSATPPSRCSSSRA